MAKQEAMFDRSLRAISWHDGMTCLRLCGVEGAAAAELAGTAPGAAIFTLNSRGEAVLVTGQGRAHTLARQFAAHRPMLTDGLSVICAAGVCMGRAENKARAICAALARAGIDVGAISLCDLALTVAVREEDRASAVRVIEAAVPLGR